MRCAYLVIHIFPVVECYQLERGEHSPAKMVKAGEAKIRIIAYIWKAGEVRWTCPKNSFSLERLNIRYIR